MGDIAVPADALYGAQTQRAVENFPISRLRFQREFLRALGLIKAAAAKYSLDPKLLECVMAAESNFNPRAISSKNALGLMQLLPETAQRMAVKNPFDPAQNIEGGARYLRLMLDRFSGNLTLALAAYNAGPDKVTLYGGVPPFRQTIDYIRRVTQRLAKSAPANSLPLG